MTHKLRGVRVDAYTYYVNKLRQNVGFKHVHDVIL